MNGVIYSAFGENARMQALLSIQTLKRNNPNIEICVVTDDSQVFRNDVNQTIQAENDPYGRETKLAIDKLSPFKHTLYMDADTRVHGKIDYLFECLTIAEFVCTISEQQNENWLWHIDETERNATLNELPCLPLQIQGGLFAFKKSPKVRSFFATWRKEYARYPAIYDQAAMTRALHHVPLKMWIVGREFNGGAVIHHLYGKARRDAK